MSLRRTKSARSSLASSRCSFGSSTNSSHQIELKDRLCQELGNEAIVIRRCEYERIKSAALVLSADDKIRQQEANLNEREKVKQQLEEELIKKSKQKSQDSMTDYDVAADEEMDAKARELRERVERYRQEQEDDVRRLNEMINEAKCLAVRENQILEKKKKNEELGEMDRQLDRRLEEERLVLDKRREELDEQRKAIRNDYARKVRQQIDANDLLQKNVEKKMRQWDAQVVERGIVSYQEDKANEIARKKEHQQKLRDGLQDCIAEKQRLQKRQAEEEAKLHKKMHDYSIQSSEWRRMMSEAEKRRTRARELKSALLARMSEASSNDTERELVLRTRRIQEKQAREWRLQQLENEKHKLNERKMLTKSREQQISMKQKEQEKKRMTESEENERIRKLDTEAVEMYNASLEQRRRNALKYASEVRQQIQKNEERLRRDDEEHLRDAQNNEKLNEDHKQTILQIKAKKLQELLSQNIPEKYLKEVARKSSVPWRNIKVNKYLY